MAPRRPGGPHRPIVPRRVAAAVAIGAGVALVAGYGADAAVRQSFPLRTDLGFARSQQLEGTVAADRAAVDRKLAGHWVPAVGASKPADVDAAFGVHLRLAASYDAVLVRSEDYDILTPGLYVSLSPHAYASKKQAQAWCSRHKLKKAQCVPVKLAERSS